MDNPIKKVHVISHFHWDREWYQDFQGFRLRLVYAIDELLDRLEQDHEYRHFTMDGQTIVIDDYLEIRPENRARLLKLIQQQRISIGPWYVMPDEFLVSGEALIRNLLTGFRRARACGVEPLKCGYVTDIFGHNSQLPQIMQGFGIGHALLFRGFKGGADRGEIWWEGADGSRLLALKLDEDRAYSDFFFFIRWPFTGREPAYPRTGLVERAAGMLKYKAERNAAGTVATFDGVDHIEIEAQLPWLLKTLNLAEELNGTEFVHSTLPVFFKELEESQVDMPVFYGEQRTPSFNGVCNALLANVLSSRVKLKQRNQQCETALVNWTEPWSVFAGREGKPYPSRMLQKAWEFLMQNHPHDSICGCSIDQVHRDMIYRFDQCQSITELALQEALVYISNHLEVVPPDVDRLVTVFNASQFPVKRIVEIELALPAELPGIVPHLMGTLFRLYDYQNQEVPYQLLEYTPRSHRRQRHYRDLPEVEIVGRFRLAFQAEVSPFGYATYLVKTVKHDQPASFEYAAPNIARPVRFAGTMRVNPGTWDNGCMRLEAGPAGTLQVTDYATGRVFDNLLIFEDEADIGDGWNHVVPVTNAVISSLRNPARLTIIHDGPLLTRLAFHHDLRVPAAIEAAETSRSENLVNLSITTYVDLIKNDPVIRCVTKLDNTARDHRLKLLFPSGTKASHYYTSTPFDLIKRPVQRPDYTDFMEPDAAVVPHNGIIAVSDGEAGVGVFTKGLYEVVVRNDEPRTIALTLFRSTGKEVMTDGGDGGQLLEHLQFEYAIRPFAAAAFPNVLWSEHQQFVNDVRTIDRKAQPVPYEKPFKHAANLSLTKSYLNINSPDLLISTIKQAEDEERSYIIRLLNITEATVQGTVTFEEALAEACIVNLDEQPVSMLNFEERKLQLEVKAKQIFTVKVVFK